MVCDIILYIQDLSLYMNPCPYTISHEAPLPQVFNLFRTMGLRHLPVMQESGIVSGKKKIFFQQLHYKSGVEEVKEAGVTSFSVAICMKQNEDSLWTT